MTDIDDQDLTIKALRERCADLEARLSAVVDDLTYLAGCPGDVDDVHLVAKDALARCWVKP